MRLSSCDRAVEAAGYGRFQRRLLWLCGLGWAADAMEVMLLSFALPAMSAEWELSAAQRGLVGAALFAGMLAGALFWGRLSDRIGRRVGFVATVAFDSLFGLASALAPSFPAFVALRCLTGFGVGGTLPVDYGMFSEFLPARDRGRRLVLLESFWAYGTIAAAGLAWLVVPRLGWRWLFALSALPGLILFAVRGSMPESPRFLAAGGRDAEAREVLLRVAAANGADPAGVEAALAAAPEGEAPGSAAAAPRGALAELLAPGLRRTTLLLWLLWFAISVGYYGGFTWLPSWLRAKGFALPSVYPTAFFLALAQLPGYWSAAYLVERWGRRRTLGTYLLGSGACALAFALARSPASIVAAAAALSFFALGSWGALYAYTPEAYPTRIRGTGIGAASGMTRLAGLVGPSIGALATTGASGAGLAGPMAAFAFAYALGGIAAFALPRETAGEELG
ncbi:MAG TPA: MFS transporter [Spirochaetales bacterium]|nr:MFS transporter [Spirochaetales bacterium]HRY54142.1 MFS transporter [Spirochaetia bacterium]